MYYLAYGSNMAAARLQQRIPSAERIGVVRLPRHRLAFDNASTKDGSGKCNALYTDNPMDLLLAVLYKIAPDSKPVLDSYEGVGVEYCDQFIKVAAPTGNMVEALIYYASNLQPQIKPFHWYKQHVLRGAEENKFPVEYIAEISAVEAIADPDSQRKERELAIYR